MSATEHRQPAVGDQFEAWQFGPLTRTDIVRYAGASGDFNPIHHDETVAASAGFPTVFSIGMLQASLLAEFGTENVRRVAVRFVSQVWPGDTLTFSDSVVRVTQTEAGTEVVADLVCTRPGDGRPEDVAVTGSMIFLLNWHEGA